MSSSSSNHHQSCHWSSNVDVDWQAGVQHDLAPGAQPSTTTAASQATDGFAHAPPQPNSSSKRARRMWEDKPRSFQSLFTEFQGRVDACWEQSAAIRECRDRADALYTAMQDCPNLDARLSVPGEQARIMARALAMKDVLVCQDATVADMMGEKPKEEVCRYLHERKFPPQPKPRVPYTCPAQGPCQPAPVPAVAHVSAQGEVLPAPVRSPAAAHTQPCVRASSPPICSTHPAAAAATRSKSGSPLLNAQQEQQQEQELQQQLHQQRVHIQRSSNEDAPDATAGECLLSVCLLLAALYEQTPFGESELRRRLFDDFTHLKRHFRHDDLPVLHGRTGSIRELFDSIKDLDRTKGLQNLLGIVFEDWKVNKRVDSFILADQITVQVTSLTPQGPIGKFVCTMRTFSTLCLLHQLLLKEMYTGMFADKDPPRKQHEPMTTDDPMDFVDFDEAMARNMPYQIIPRGKRNIYYAWMYAPEANATAETWEQVFGQKDKAVPALHDEVCMPESLVRHLDEDGDYSLDLNAAIEHDLREEGLSQTPLAFPWADDLLGEFLRRLRQERKNRPWPKQEPKPEQASSHHQQQHQQGVRPGVKQEAPQELHPPADASVHLQGCQQSGLSNGIQGAHCNGSHQHSVSANGMCSMAQGNGVQGACQGKHSPQANGFCHSACAASPSPSSLQPQQPNGHAHPAESSDKPPPIVNAEESGRLVLPLGIFLVGIICSGAHTNTQIHVEDLLLMSININMFGAPKVWWWVPKESVQEFKNYAESMTEGGRKELYTKSISPFLQDREEHPPQPTLPLERLRLMGVKRTIQMPGMGILTMPGYAFHFTVSQGFNLAESCNMFLEVMGWTFEKLWKARPLEQYPNDIDDMARYLRDTGVLARLGVPDCLPDHPKRVHRSLKQHNLGHGKVVNSDGTKLQRYVTPDLVKYVSQPSKEKQEEECKRLIRQRQEQRQPIIVIV